VAHLDHALSLMCAHVNVSHNVSMNIFKQQSTALVQQVVVSSTPTGNGNNISAHSITPARTCSAIREVIAEFADVA